MENTKKISPEKVYYELWSQGELNWALRAHQVDLYNSYKECTKKMVVWNCSRRLGKSAVLCIIALETCIKTPNATVKYTCAKQKDAKNIIRPLLREILDTYRCPKDLRPRYMTQDGAYVFPNGSRIELSGLDGGRADGIRGGSAHLAIVDEAALVDDLKDIIRSIILPTTTTTKGKIILASTPPKTPDHPFVYYIRQAAEQGNLVTKTVYDNSYIDKEELDKIIEESGGVDSVDFRREYLAHIIRDENYSVVPEFTPELKEKIVKEMPRAVFYDAYVAMDLGMKDLTAVLFAWYDFRNAKIVIEDEFSINGQKFNTQTLALGIKEKESVNFTDKITGEQKTPYLRISDNNLIVIKDLYDLHSLTFLPTRKDDADAALNNMKILLQNERIIIHPRCKTLISHLESAVWNKSKTSMERSSDFGHYDFLDALKYLVRNVQLQKNPYPNSWGLGNVSNLHIPKRQDTHPQENAFGKIMGFKRK